MEAYTGCRDHKKANDKTCLDTFSKSYPKVKVPYNHHSKSVLLGTSKSIFTTQFQEDFPTGLHFR